MQGRGIRRIGLALGAIAATGGFAPSLAQADSTSPSWNCRSSIAYVKTALPAPLNYVEPFAANGDPLTGADRATCADDSQAVPQINVPAGLPLTLTADAVKGVTALDPDTGPARAQTATAAVSAADVNLVAAGIPIKAKAILSSATVSCVANAPKFVGTSLFAGLNIAGQDVPLQDGIVQITTVVNDSPLSMLVKIQLNQQLTGGSVTTDSQGLIQRAATVELLNLTGTPLATVVLGEAKVSRNGRACDADTTTPTTPTSPNDPTTTTTVTTPTPTPTPSIIYVPVSSGSGSGSGANSGSGTGNTTTIQINGQNGGCGKLQMYFVGPKKLKVASSKYGVRTVTRGRLLSCGGKPIVGGRIDVYHVIKGRKTRIRKTGVRSRAGGLITLILPLNLTTRKIVFEYRGNLASTKVTAHQTLDLTVRYKGKVITKEPGPKRKASF